MLGACNPSSFLPPLTTPSSYKRKKIQVTASQAPNQGRVAFCGSLALFSDKFFVATPATGNRLFASAISKWVFGEKGVLRVREFTHKGEKGEVNPPGYRIKDTVTVSVIIEEYDGDTKRFDLKGVFVYFFKIVANQSPPSLIMMFDLPNFDVVGGSVILSLYWFIVQLGAIQCRRLATRSNDA
jgi:hypothetical protein